MIDGEEPSAKYKRKALPSTLDSLPFPSTVLGAQGWDVLGLVMKQGAGMVAIGVAAGLVTAFDWPNGGLLQPSAAGRLFSLQYLRPPLVFNNGWTSRGASPR